MTENKESRKTAATVTGLIYYMACLKGQLLFIIFICDLFYFEENVDIASYADGNTSYCVTHVVMIFKLQ